MLIPLTGDNIKSLESFGENKTLRQKFQKIEGKKRNSQNKKIKKWIKKSQRSQRSISS